MFNERSAQEHRRQIAEKLAKMDEERALLIKMRDDVDAWLALNGVQVGGDQLSMLPPTAQPRESPVGPTAEAGSNRAIFVSIIEEEATRGGLSARQVWEIAEARGVTSTSPKPERTTSAALVQLVKRGVIRSIKGKYYPKPRSLATT